MKSLYFCRPVWILVTSCVFLAASAAHAQVESLNPNPTWPAGTGSASELEEYHHGSSAGAKMGRAIGGRVDGADKNPAEMMLRELNGTNRGRRTGHAAIRGEPVRAAQRVEAYRHIPPFRDESAVYFARRGDYENVIYAPYRGSYRQPSPQTTLPARRANQR
ncbi:MAG: hypothetical protein ACREHD_02105 [Pirellulales bacterium]